MTRVDGADDRDADALACGLPTNVFVRPAGAREPADVVDEVLDALRIDALRRSHALRAPRDRLRVTLAAYAMDLLYRFANEPRCETKSGAMKRAMEDALGRFACPGDADYDLASVCAAPRTDEERERYRRFVRRCREAIAVRMVERCYVAEDGTRDKFWMAFARRRFLNRPPPKIS